MRNKFSIYEDILHICDVHERIYELYIVHDYLAQKVKNYFCDVILITSYMTSQQNLYPFISFLVSLRFWLLKDN